MSVGPPFDRYKVFEDYCTSTIMLSLECRLVKRHSRITNKCRLTKGWMDQMDEIA